MKRNHFIAAVLGLFVSATALAVYVEVHGTPQLFKGIVYLGSTLASSKTDGTMLITSDTPDAITSTSVGAITLKSTVNVTDGDLVLDVQNSAAGHIFKCNEQGLCTALTALVATTTVKGTTGVIAGTAGATITGSHASGALTLDLGTTTNSCSVTAEQTVTGAQVGDACTVGVNATAGGLGGSWSCYVSSAGKAIVKFCNPTAGAIDPASGAFYVRTFSEQ